MAAGGSAADEALAAEGCPLVEESPAGALPGACGAVDPCGGSGGDPFAEAQLANEAMAEVQALSRVVERYAASCPIELGHWRRGQFQKWRCCRPLVAASLEAGLNCYHCQASLGGTVGLRCPGKKPPNHYTSCRACFLKLAVQARRGAAGGD